MPVPLVVAFVVGVTPGKWARTWNERMPRHPLELRPLAQTEAVDALLAGEVGAAFLRSPSPLDGCNSIELYVELPVVVVPKGHAIEALDDLDLADLAAENVLDAIDPDAAVELVAANVGVVVLPQSVARALSRRDVVARPLTDGPRTGVNLVWREGDSRPEVEELVGIVRGRTANSSRGAEPPPQKLSASQKAAAKKARRLKR